MWRARKAAEATHSLSQEAAAFVDQQLVGRIHSAGIGLLKRLAAEAAAKFEPENQKTDEEQAIADSGVDLRDRLAFGYAGTSELHAVGDTVDLAQFYDYLNALATGFAADGDTSPLGLRQIRVLRSIAGGDDPLPEVDASGLAAAGTGKTVPGFQRPLRIPRRSASRSRQRRPRRDPADPQAGGHRPRR